MANKPVTILARFKAKPGMEQKLEQSLLNMIEPTRSESGCINYDLHKAVDEPSVFILYENWTNHAALVQHFETSYFKAITPAVKEMVVEPFEMTFLEMITPLEGQ